MAGTTADAVRLFRNADEDGVDVEKFQSRVELFGFGNGCAVIRFAGHDECGGFYFGDEIGERALHVLLGVIPWIAGEPIFCGPGNVAGEDKAVPVNDGIEARGGAKAFGVLDGPGGEDATAAATRDKEIASVDVAFGDDGVDAAIEVGEIVTGIGVVDEIGEFFAVAGA